MIDAAGGRSAAQFARTRHGILLLAASVMPIMAIISLVPVLPLLLREFADVEGHSFLVPVALTIPALCVAIFSPLAGWLSDRVGRKGLLVAALFLYAGFGIVPWFLDDLMLIIAARVALGITEAVIMTVSITLIGDYFEGERREKWIALQVAVGSISAIFLIAIGGGLGELFGSRGPFLLYLLALPIAALAATILFEPAVRTARTPGDAARFPYGAVVPLVATTLCVGIIFYTMLVQLGPILERSGDVSPGTIGVIGALTNLGVGAGTFAFHRLKRFVGARLLALGLTVAAIGYAGAGLSSGLVPIGGFAVLACIGSGIMLANMLTWTLRRVPGEMRGRGTGMWTGAFFLGQFLAPIVAAATIELTQGMAQALLAYAGLIAVAAVAALLASRGRANRGAA